MKLKTKIIISSCMAVMMALVLSAIVIWRFWYEKADEQAVFQGYQKSYDIINAMEKSIQNFTKTKEKKIAINYYLKSQNDKYNICYFNNDVIETQENDSEQRIDENPEINEKKLYEETQTQNIEDKTKNTYANKNERNQNTIEEIFNPTTFTYDDLSELDYEIYGNNTERSLSFCKMKKSGRNYVIYSNYINQNISGYYFYHIEDITYVKEEMIQWLIVMSEIIAFIAIITMGYLWLILTKALKPLKELSDKANHIAKGDYSERVKVKGNDEISLLGNNFNSMAEAVQMREKRLVESEQKKTLFMGDLTHELKTPMTAILGYAQTLLTVKLSEEDREEALNYIVEQCKRLERMSKKMTRLLELGQSNDLEIKKEKVIDLFENAVKSCDGIIKDKEISVRVIENGETYMMDLDLMTNVLINLIDNGIKASQNKAEIILEANENTIKVTDFGKGIPKEEQKKILEPFYMVDKSRSRKNGGAGLGLALVSAILQKHNVKIFIESEEGKGSTFILEFPE